MRGTDANLAVTFKFCVQEQFAWATRAKATSFA